MDLGKVFPVAGIGSPLRSKKLFLVTLLLEAGYKLSAASGSANYEDSVDLVTGERKWIFVFSGSGRVCWDGQDLLPKQAADIITGKTADNVHGQLLSNRRKIYAEYQPRAELPADCSANIVQQHAYVVDAVKNSPKHVVAHRGRARYWLPAELPADQREIEMDKIDARYKSA